MNISAVGIISKQPKASMHFYNLLGLQFEELGEGHWEARSASGVRLMVDSEELILKINPTWNSNQGSRIVVCHESGSSEEVDSLFDKLVSEGFTSIKPPFDAFWGQRYCSIMDPDGNQVDIFSDLEVK